MSERANRLGNLFLSASLLGGLYLIGRMNYLVFHFLSEMFTIAIAGAIFMFAWNSRRFIQNDYFTVIGVAYLGVGIIQSFHTLAYSGMDIIATSGANEATQLWLSARFLESGALFLAPAFVIRRIRPMLLMGLTAFYTGAIFFFIFVFRVFPPAFLPDSGLTGFKINSEYLIIALSLGAAFRLYRRREFFSRAVLSLLFQAIFWTIVSESFFVSYVSVYDLANLLGHFAMIFSFYLVYRVVIYSGLNRPLETLFRDLKQSENSLREQKDRLQKYLDIANILFVVLDKNGRVRLINKKGLQLLGKKEDEIINKRWIDNFVPEPNRKTVRGEFERKLGDSGAKESYFENPINTAQGTRLIGWHNAILTDAGGDFAGVLAAGEDITDRFRAEQERKKFLAELERLSAESGQRAEILNSVLSSLTEPVLFYDSSLRISYANQAAVNFLGFSPLGFDHNEFTERVERADPSAKENFWEDIFREAVKEGKVVENRMYFIRSAENRRREVLISAISLKSDSGAAGAVISWHDVTEQEQAKKVLRRDKETFERLVRRKSDELFQAQIKLNQFKRLSDIGTLAATVAHELRNPLGVIRTAVFNLKRKITETSLERHLENIEKKIAESDQIINNLLNYSRIKAPQPERVRIDELLQECVKTAHARFKSEKTELDVDLKPVSGRTAEIDPFQVTEVINNILNNAYQSRKASGTVRIWLRAEQRNSVYEITVRDNGSGIDPEDQKHIFEPFFTRKSKGTGLGLSIANEMIHLNGGDITVNSSPGKGTEVRIFLPARIS